MVNDEIQSRSATSPMVVIVALVILGIIALVIVGKGGKAKVFDPSTGKEVVTIEP